MIARIHNKWSQFHGGHVTYIVGAQHARGCNCAFSTCLQPTETDKILELSALVFISPRDYYITWTFEFPERKKETFNLEAEGGGRKKSLQKGKKKFLHRVINNDILETTTVESNQGPKESKRRGSTRYSRVVTFRSLAGTMNTCGGRGVGATTMIRPPLGKLHHYESRTDSFAAPRHEPLRPRSWNNWIAGVQYVSRGN